MTSTPEQVIAKIREAVYASKDMPLNSADRLRVTVDDPSLFSDYISEDAEWAIESLEALLSALEAAESERDALRKAAEALANQAEHCVMGSAIPGMNIKTAMQYLAEASIAVRRTLAGDNHE